jgi:hypothetical protein
MLWAMVWQNRGLVFPGKIGSIMISYNITKRGFNLPALGVHGLQAWGGMAQVP